MADIKDKDVKAFAPDHPKHDKETHAMSDDIDGNTLVDELKGPSVAMRVKEEFEALVGVVVTKKDNN